MRLVGQVIPLTLAVTVGLFTASLANAGPVPAFDSQKLFARSVPCLRRNRELDSVTLLGRSS
jgi:hypothetical protein